MAQQRIESVLKAATDAQKVPGIAAIALDRSGNQILKAVSGTININDASARPMTYKTSTMIHSCTKLVTSVCALQLIEAGKLQLDDLVEKFVPEIADVKVLDGFNDDGSPKLRSQKIKPTVRMLLTHTTGFTYDFFDRTTLKYRIWKGDAPHTYATKSDFSTPLLFEPGTQYSYGINTDWVGFVVEAISGLKIQDYMTQHIFEPLGMHDTSAYSPKFTTEGLLVHFRNAEDGKLIANPAFAHDPNASFYGGGHFLYSTLDDYSSFLLAILNNGTHPHSDACILKDTTVKEYLFQDQISPLCTPTNIGAFDSASPMLTNAGELLPGLKKSWSTALMLNVDANPKGRSAGSGAWAGLGNLYYWLDPVKGKLGLVMSAILPFVDREVLNVFDEVERAVYGHEEVKAGKDRGSFKTSAP